MTGAIDQFIKRLTKVKGKTKRERNQEDYDYIVAFCLATTDLQSAQLRIPVGKPVILVVLHNTFNHKHNRTHVTPRDDILRVDCLLNDSNTELHDCPKNKRAVTKCRNKIKGKPDKRNKPDKHAKKRNQVDKMVSP